MHERMLAHCILLKTSSPEDMLIDFIERKIERQKHWSVASCRRPDRGSNLQPFGVRDNTPTEPPGQSNRCCIFNQLLIDPFLTGFFFFFYYHKKISSPDCVVQLVGASSHPLKGLRFDSQSRHIHRLWVWSLVRVHTGGTQSMFLSRSDVSLSL